MKAVRVGNISANVDPDLKQVIHQFQQWRAGRGKIERIPEALWQAAGSLYPRYSVFRIARALRLNFNDMRDRIHGNHNLGLKHSRGAVGGSAADGFHFMEMPAAAATCGEECQLKVRIGARGSRISIRLRGAGVGQMLERLRGLWSCGA